MKKVLVVDNNPVVLKYMESFLTKNLYSVKTAENGLIALDIVKDYTPDFIFVDLIMPYIDGELLVSIFRKNERLINSSIIILSGVAAEIELDYIAMGANACIAKGPFNTMGNHISHTLNKLTTDDGREQFSKVIGLENVFKRSITEELMMAKLHKEIVLESISDVLIEISTDLRIVYLNTAAHSFLGKDEKDIIASNILDQIDSEWHKEFILYLDQVKNDPSVNPIELIRDNECYLLTVKYLRSKSDITIFLIVKDITIQKQREKDLSNKINEREMMIKEVYHRVKNNLTMVSSIINLQISESENEIELNSLNDLRSRIDSISMVHAKLFRGNDLNNIRLDEYISDLVENLIDSLVQSEASVVAEILIPEISIDFDKAVPLGIVFTELTTNSLKYAFSDRDTGLISITYTDKEDKIEITFADNGIGLSSDFVVEEAESLGINLIFNLVKQLQGRINVENKNGTVFTITLPRL